MEIFPQEVRYPVGTLAYTGAGYDRGGTFIPYGQGKSVDEDGSHIVPCGLFVKIKRERIYIAYPLPMVGNRQYVYDFQYIPASSWMYEGDVIG